MKEQRSDLSVGGRGRSDRGGHQDRKRTPSHRGSSTRSSRAQRLLAEASAMLAASLDYETTLQSVARLAVPTLADWCIVYIVEGERSIRRVAAAGAGPREKELLAELQQRVTFDWNSPAPAISAIRTGQPLLIEEVSEELLPKITGDAAQLGLFRKLALRSLMAVPLIARGTTLGAIALSVSGSGRRYGPDDLALAVELAVRAALAVDNARLFREVELARADALQQAAQNTAILEQMADAVIVVDADGRITLANPAAGKLFAVAPADLHGISPAMLPWRIYDATGRELEPEQRPLIRALRGETAAGEVRTVTAKGVERWTWFAAVPLRDQAGCVQGAISVIRDTTQVRRLFREAAESDKLRALGQMASGIAHDFNNALAMIIGFTELLLARPGQLKDRRKVAEYLGYVNTAAEDATRVVRRLREFYRQREAGDVFAPVDLNLIVAESISLTQPRWRDQALATGITVNIVTQLEGLPLITANAADLREALANLVFNAVDALPIGGNIVISTRVEHDYVELEVLDTGTGMTEEVRRRCLEPFYTTKGESGTGLGLAMVHGMVRRHEGTIEIDSAPDRGTSVSIRLPLNDQVEPEKSLAAPLDGVLPPLRILVVEDELRLRELLVELLSGDGHMVEAAVDGREALTRFQSGTFDLTLTDRAMPRMSGDQLAMAIKEIAPTQPVILLTGFGEIMRSESQRPPGVDLVISKPIRLATLRRAMARVVRS